MEYNFNVRFFLTLSVVFHWQCQVLKPFLFAQESGSK